MSWVGVRHWQVDAPASPQRDTAIRAPILPAMLRSLSRSSRPLQVRIARMSSQAQPAPQYFFVYAPDKTEEGTFERRMSVRPKHLATAHERTGQGLIRMLDTISNWVHAILTILPAPSVHLVAQVLEGAC